MSIRILPPISPAPQTYTLKGGAHSAPNPGQQHPPRSPRCVCALSDGRRGTAPVSETLRHHVVSGIFTGRLRDPPGVKSDGWGAGSIPPFPGLTKGFGTSEAVGPFSCVVNEIPCKVVFSAF